MLLLVVLLTSWVAVGYVVLLGGGDVWGRGALGLQGGGTPNQTIKVAGNDNKGCAFF